MVVESIRVDRLEAHVDTGLWAEGGDKDEPGLVLSSLPCARELGMNVGVPLIV